MSIPSDHDTRLPPVEPPSAGFLLQLFFIPMIIVSIIVMVWLMFSWLAHMGNDPGDLVKGLEKNRWQDAAILADLLRDPHKEFLRSDSQLAGQISAALQRLNGEKDSDDEHIKLRLFLCTALGEFHILDGLPTLLETANLQNRPADIEVRQQAVQAIAVMANNLGSELIRQQDDVVDTVITASRERDETSDPRHRKANLRAAAAFTLGVLGGDEALQRLERMLGDPFPNARYNAATGLARNGDCRAIPQLLAMLDPTNENTTQGEEQENRAWKRTTVLVNGIRASQLLRERAADDDLSRLRSAIEQLDSPETDRAVRIAAREALDRWEQLADR